MDGQRVAKHEGGSRLPWIIGGCAAGALAAAYIGLCVWAGGRDTILPNVSVAGVDVSNLTVEQARQAVDDMVSQRSGDISLTLSYEDVSHTFTAADLEVDTAQSVQDAWQVGRESFLTGGPVLLSHMMGGSSEIPMALPEGERGLDGVLSQMEREVAAGSEHAAYELEEDQLVMTKGVPALTVDWEQVRWDTEAALQHAFARRFSGEVSEVSSTVPLTASQSETQEPDFDAIHQALYTEPRDAQLDLETMTVSDHQEGLDFDVEALRTAYQSAKGGETFSIPVTRTQPKVTRESLESQMFQDLLGEGTTQVSGSANRKHNVKLSAEACNNIILLPGEEFSYNNTTGSRSADKGYKDAPIYQAGQSVEDIGGGICQTSSTIYYAVLHTNLEVVERHCHQFNTGYVDLGMDATVYYGSLDFRFKNSTDYPIKIVTNSYDSNGNRYLNVKIYGTNPDGIYAVPKSSTFDKVAPTTVYSPDPSVPRGSLVLDKAQYAYTGWSAHTYRYVYDRDGNELEKQDMGGSRYKMRPNTYHYNPADGDPSSWVNGKPADPGTAAPEQPADPGTAAPEQPVDPGTTTPEQPVDPGTATPEQPVDPGTATPEQPVDPGASTPEQPTDTDLDILTPPGDGTEG